MEVLPLKGGKPLTTSVVRGGITIRLPFSLLVKLGVSQQIVDLLWQALLFIIAVRLIVFIFRETTIKNICAFATVLLIILVVLEFHGML